MNKQDIISIPHDEIMNEAIETFGKEYQIDRFIEEATELIQALLRNRRVEGHHTQDEIQANIQEEIGDTIITLAQVIKIHGDPEIIKANMNEKIRNLNTKIQEKKQTMG